MEHEQYDVMFRREERHWWYAGMRHSALALLRAVLRDQGPVRLLDAGCGTGGTTVHLREFGPVFGLDFARAALLPAASRGLAGQVAQGSIEQLPFRDGTFDVVTSFDVLYHLGVGDDRHALAEFRRVLRDDAWLLLRVPAHDWLRGEHDRLVHTRHRYARGEVQEKLETAGFRVERLSWANTVLFPPAAAKRLVEMARPPASDTTAAEPDLWQPPALLNALLARIVGVEAAALPRAWPLPFGLSLIALARAA